MRSLWFLLLLLAAGPLSAQQDEPKEKEVVRVPRPLAIPQRMEPPASPDARITLRRGQWCIIEATEKIEPACSPDGYLTFTDERKAVGGKPGPIHFAAPFADRDETRPWNGFPEDERRSYDREFVWSVKPAKAGDCELLVFVASTGKLKRVKMTCVLDSKPEPDPIRPDDFAAAVRLAWAMETDANRAAHLTALIRVYQTGQTSAKSAATWGDVFSAMLEKAKTEGIAGVERGQPGKLPKVQVALAAELKKVLPSLGASEEPMTTTAKDTAAVQFGRVLKALEELK